MAVQSGDRKPAVDGRKERWKAHRAARREAFIDAALRTLAKDGPELHVDHVAAEAGVTKPVLYRQFKDKSDLLDALHERATAMLMDRLTAAVDPAAAPSRQISKAIEAFLSLLDDQPNLYWLVSRTVPAGPGSEGSGVRMSKALAADLLTHLFDDFLRGFDVRTEETVVVAQAIVGMVHTTGEWWLESKARSRQETVDQLTSFVWYLLDGYLRARGIEVDPDVPVTLPATADLG